MYLYEKDKDIVNVYELKAMRDKIFNFKRKEMEKNGKHNLVYSIFSNNIDDIRRFKEVLSYDLSDLIQKENLFFKHKNGIKLVENNYYSENYNNIDGLLYQLYCGDYDFFGDKITKLVDNNNKLIAKYLLFTTSDIKNHKIKSFDRKSFEYELPNILSIPESIYLLRLLMLKEFRGLVDKNIDEQLALYEFNDTPIQKLDMDTIRFMSKNYLSEDELELNQNILKKVRQINK